MFRARVTGATWVPAWGIRWIFGPPRSDSLFAVPGGGVAQPAAEELCGLGTAHGIDCRLVELPGRHDWPSATTAFVATLPWLAERLRC
ncbi:hypothetical protein AWC20_22260 [Mycobacterium parmense]|nr:hypothetical protein AWC20_22260 [Mycobacterium parmense]